MLREVGPSEERIGASVESGAGSQSLEEPGLREVNSGLREEENRTSVRSEPGSVWTEAWPPWGQEPNLSEEWSRASLRTIAGPQCRAERSRVSLRTGAHPVCGVEPGLSAEWRLASEKQSLASRRSKVRSQGGSEVNRSEK